MKKGTAYSHEQKVAIIQEYTEQRRTPQEICEKYSISKSSLCYLLKQYPYHSPSGVTLNAKKIV